MDNNKCENAICGCQTANDSDYCSDHCHDATKQGITEIKCDCGCPSCGD